MNRASKTSIILAVALSALAATFLGSFFLIYGHYQNTLVEDERLNQLKISQTVAQSLDLYFDKLKYITEQAVNTGTFDYVRNFKEDGLRFAKISAAKTKKVISLYRPANLLKSPRLTFDPAYAPTGFLENWQVFKGLPESDWNGRPVARERRQLARSVLNTFPDLHYAFEMEMNGDLVFLEPFDTQKDISSFNYEFRDYLQLIKQTRRTVISEGYLSHDLNRTRIITVATPIFDNANRIVKLFAVSVSATTLRERVFQSLKESMNVTDGTVFYLVDRHGHVVASSSGRNLYFPMTGKKDDREDAGNLRGIGFFKDLEWKPDLLEKGNIWERDTNSWTPAFLKKNYFAQYKNLSGETVFATFYPKSLIPGDSPNVGILVETPINRFSEAASHLRRILFLSGFALLLLVAGIGIIIFRGFGRLRSDLLETEKEINDVQLEVFHNIGSPLTALESVLPLLAPLPEGTRVLIRNAIQNMRDVVNGLRSNPRKSRHSEGRSFHPKNGSKDELSPKLLYPLIDLLVSEKRIEYRDRPAISIESEIPPDYHGLFAAVDPVEFHVLLSNLINNAVDSIPGKGQVRIGLNGTAGRISVTVEDSGCGIAPEILKRLNDSPFSFGKKSGSGVGLRHAKKNIESWGGSLWLDSLPGAGTRVIVEIPRSPAPAWFASTIRVPISESGDVIILDDDPGIHSIWKRRIGELNSDGRSSNVRHLQCENEFRRYLKDQGPSPRNLFLIDYELGPGQACGLDLIREFGIAHQSILVTSRWDEGDLFSDARIMGVKILPKSMAPVIPMELEICPSPIDCVLIDDDPVTALNWAQCGRRHGKQVRIFAKAQEFFEKLEDFPKNTPIFIDSMLGDGLRGEVLAERIYGEGFPEINLVTALPTQSFRSMPWIRSIRPKTPPWAE